MAEAAVGKIQETQVHRYKSTTGFRYDSVPFRLWDKSKKLFWDPADLDFSRDAEDWAGLTKEQQFMLASSARGFMVGEEAVTLDILPLLRAISDEGRLEETMYLSMFAMEEAKHVDFFRRWFDAIGFDPRELDAAVQAQNNGYSVDGDKESENGDANGQPRRRGIFDGDLTRIMRRLDTDRSPEAFLDASLLYNHLIEAIAAISGYRRWNEMFTAIGTDKLSAFQEGLGYVQRDERRHIAYGTYLCRRIIAEHPETWDFVEKRWNKMVSPLRAMQAQSGNGYGSGEQGSFMLKLADRRLDVLRSALGKNAEDIEQSTIEELEPEGM